MSLHGESKEKMSLLKISSAGDVNEEASFPILWSPRLQVSPNGTKVLCSGTPFGKFSPRFYLYQDRQNGQVQILDGLLKHNVWVSDDKVFTTDGTAWKIVDADDFTKPLYEGTLVEQNIVMHQCSVLQDGRVVLIGSFKGQTLKSVAIIIDWKSDTKLQYVVDCEGFSSHDVKHVGMRKNNQVWLGTDNKQILLNE